MKKLFILAAVGAFALSSCKLCYECTYEVGGVSTSTGEFCSGGGDSRQDVKDAVEQLEDAGYTCEKQ